MRLIGVVLVCGLLAGCAGMGQAFQPTPQWLVSEFDGAVELRLAPVRAGSGGDQWQALGLFWSDRLPDEVVLEVDRPGTVRIASLGFNADGRVLEAAPAEALTRFTPVGGLKSSMRRFVLSWADFEALAAAEAVVMRVGDGTVYGLSHFGADHPGVAISTQLPAFASEVRAARGD